MIPEELEILKTVVSRFQTCYPNSHIRMEGSMIYATVYDRELYIHVEKGFNTEGYDLLYCLNELCKLLKEKLR